MPGEQREAAPTDAAARFSEANVAKVTSGVEKKQISEPDDADLRYPAP